MKGTASTGRAVRARRLTQPRCAASMMVAALALAPACTEEGAYVRLGPERVLYDGEPYGDFVILADAVRQCMESDDPTLPRLILVEDPFECHTTFGWKTVFGCTGEDEIFLVASIVVDTGGMLWAHELTHYFGADHENDPCGALALETFSLALPGDGGM